MRLSKILSWATINEQKQSLYVLLQYVGGAKHKCLLSLSPQKWWGKGYGHTHRNQNTFLRKLNKQGPKDLSITLLVAHNDYLQDLGKSFWRWGLNILKLLKMRHCFRDMLFSMQGVLSTESHYWEASWVYAIEVFLYSEKSPREVPYEYTIQGFLYANKFSMGPPLGNKIISRDLAVLLSWKVHTSMHLRSRPHFTYKYISQRKKNTSHGYFLSKYKRTQSRDRCLL